MVDVETLMRRLAESGVTAILKVDHERYVEDGDYWTFVISGGALAENVGYVRAEERALDQCIAVALSRLAELGERWSWVREFISNDSDAASGQP